MTLNRYAKKRDANEAEIFAVLRAHGLSVYPIDVPADCIVGYGGQTWLVEVKGLKGKLTGPQKDFYEDWKGNKTILRSAEGAHEFAKKVRQTCGPDGPKTLGELFVMDM